MEQRLSDRCSVTWTPAALLLLISQVLALESRSLFRIFLSLQTETPLNHILLLFWFVTFYYGLTCTLKMIWPGRLPPLRTWVSGYLLSKGFVSGKVPQGKHNVMNWLFYKHLRRLVGLNIFKTSHSQRVVPGPATYVSSISGNLLKIQILDAQARVTESETQWIGPSNLPFNKISRGLWYMLQLENCQFTLPL